MVKVSEAFLQLNGHACIDLVAGREGREKAEDL
jgi:hypothetical protein